MQDLQIPIGLGTKKYSQTQFLVEEKKVLTSTNDKDKDKEINRKEIFSNNLKEEKIKQKLKVFREKFCPFMGSTPKTRVFRNVRWIVVTTVCVLLWLLFLAVLGYLGNVLEQNGGFIPWVLNTTHEFPAIFESEDTATKETKTNEELDFEKKEEREQDTKNRSDTFRFFIKAQNEKFPELPWRIKLLWAFQPTNLFSCIVESYFEKFTLIDALLRYITEQDCLPVSKAENPASSKPILGTLDERRHSKLICHREKLIDKLFECYEPMYKRIHLLSDVETTLEERRFVKSLVKFLSTQLIRYPISISLLLRRDTNSLFKQCLKEREEWVNYVVGQKVMELNFLPSVLAKHVCAYL